MPTPNITPTAETDGVLYSNAVPLTSTEADLWGGTSAQGTGPFPTVYGAAIIATVQLSVTGLIVGNSTYVVMQQDLGDSVWVDLNWLVWVATQGTATFVFSNGVAGANTFQQSRALSQVPNPQASGSNQLTLGGRVRFTGRTAMTGGSSSVADTPAAVSATIRYKLLGLR